MGPFPANVFASACALDTAFTASLHSAAGAKRWAKPTRTPNALAPNAMDDTAGRLRKATPMFRTTGGALGADLLARTATAAAPANTKMRTPNTGKPIVIPDEKAKTRRPQTT